MCRVHTSVSPRPASSRTCAPHRNLWRRATAAAAAGQATDAALKVLQAATRGGASTTPLAVTPFIDEVRLMRADVRVLIELFYELAMVVRNRRERNNTSIPPKQAVGY